VKILKEFCVLSSQLNTTSRSFCTPTCFTNALVSNDKRWTPGTQQDSHAFGKYLISGIWEVISNCKQGFQAFKSIVENLNYSIFIKQLLIKHTVDINFGALYSTVVNCLQCKDLNYSYETLTELSLSFILEDLINENGIIDDDIIVKLEN